MTHLTIPILKRFYKSFGRILIKTNVCKISFMNDQIIKKLKDREKLGIKRQLKNNSELIDFVSNDYLGLSRSRTLFDRINGYDYSRVVNLNGSTGSRLLAGHSLEMEQLERKLSDLFNSAATLLFNSGYVANLALLSCIPQRGDTIIYDSLSHICLKEGAALSKATRYSFKHNDCNDLETKLIQAKGEKYIVIESVYSMDGDMAPFDDIIQLAKKYEAKIIVDEAHSTGLYGENGAGKLCERGIEAHIFARVYTFGKAMGVHGAAIAGSKELIDYLINYARPFIYTTAMPMHSVFSIDGAFDYIKENIHLQKESEAKIQYFNTLFQQRIEGQYDVQKIESLTPIQPIIVPGNEQVKTISNRLQTKGYDVRPILYPTVKEGSERLRISIHTHNTENEIATLVDHLSELL